MHFLSVSAVAQELKRGPLNSATTFRYFAAWLILNTALGYYDVHLMAPPTQLVSAQALFIVAVTVLGLYRCYVANGGAIGSDLTGRFVVLALPLTVQLTIAYEVLYWIAYLIYPGMATFLSDRVYELLWLSMNVAGVVLMFAIWYWRMARLLRSIHNSTNLSESSDRLTDVAP